MTTWKIVSLERKTADGFVTTAHWTCTGVDGEFSGSVYGSIGFEGELVTPYADLTEADVIGWVHAEMGAEQVAAYESNIAAQIEAQKHPTQALGLPW